MRATGREQRGDGFTLVELLIALAMISLIALLLFSGLRLGLRAWESIDAATEQIGELRLAHGFLARILSQARVASTLVEAETVAIFGGDAESLEFAAPLSEQVGVSGLYVLRLTLEDRGDARALVLTRWLLHPEVLEGGDGFPPWEPLDQDGARSVADLPVDLDAADGAFGRTLLLDRVDTFEILYHGVAEGETDPDWHEDWFEQTNPPTQLRIRLTTAARTWPDLVIALPGRRS
jgi:general secretion pathway protein J